MAGSDWRRHRHARGFTLVEVTVAVAVLAFAVAAVTQAVVAGQMQTYQAIHGNRAVALAEAMLDEVLVLPYHDPGGGGDLGPEQGEPQRHRFDNIDDYHGHAEPAGQVRDHDRDAYPEAYQAFSRAVRVSEHTQTTDAFGDQPGLLITVTVTDARGQVWPVTRFVPAPADPAADEPEDNGGRDEDDDDRDDEDDDNHDDHRGRGRGGRG